MLDPRIAAYKALCAVRAAVWHWVAETAVEAAMRSYGRSWKAQEDAEAVAARAGASFLPSPTHPDAVSVHLCAGQVVLAPGSTLTDEQVRAIDGDDIEIIRTTNVWWCHDCRSFHPFGPCPDLPDKET